MERISVHFWLLDIKRYNEATNFIFKRESILLWALEVLQKLFTKEVSDNAEKCPISFTIGSFV